MRREAIVLAAVGAALGFGGDLRDDAPPARQRPSMSARKPNASVPRVTFLPGSTGSGRHETFAARGPRTAAAVSATEAVLTQVEPLWDDERVAAALRDPSLARPQNHPERRARHLRLRMLGADADAPAATEGRVAWTTNVYLGDDPSEWRVDVPSYTRAVYDEVWPGVDVAWHGERGGIEFDFVVAPGADPGAVAFHADDPTGETVPRLDASGALVVGDGRYPLRLSAPVVWQDVGGRRVHVDGRYVCDPPDARGRVRVGFAVGDYDRTRALVIDPGIVATVSFSSLLGGGSDDDVRKIVRRPGMDGVDVVLCNTPQVFSTAHSQIGLTDVLVLELDAQHNVTRSAVVGGKSGDTAHDADLGADGALSVCGSTFSNDFTATPGTYTGTGSGLPSGFVFTLDASLALMSSCRFAWGGSVSIAQVERVSGAVYLAGSTTSSTLPTSPGAWLATKPTGGGFGSVPYFACMTFELTTVTALTYLGQFDGTVDGMDVLADGDIAFGLSTPDRSVPVAGGGLPAVDGYDVFVGVIDPAGTSISNSTYIAGMGNDFVGALVSADPGPGFYGVGTAGSGAGFNATVPQGVGFSQGNSGLVFHVDFGNPPGEQVEVVDVLNDTGNMILNDCGLDGSLLGVCGFGDVQNLEEISFPDELTRGGGNSETVLCVYRVADDVPPEKVVQGMTGGNAHDIGVDLEFCDECFEVLAVTGSTSGVPLIDEIQALNAGGDDAWILELAVQEVCDPPNVPQAYVVQGDVFEDGLRSVRLHWTLAEPPPATHFKVVTYRKKANPKPGEDPVTVFRGEVVPRELEIEPGDPAGKFTDRETHSVQPGEELTFEVVAINECGSTTSQAVSTVPVDAKTRRVRYVSSGLEVGIDVAAVPTGGWTIDVTAELKSAVEADLAQGLLALSELMVGASPMKRAATATVSGRLRMPPGERSMVIPLDTANLSAPLSLKLTLALNGKSKTTKLKLKPPKKPK